MTNKEKQLEQKFITYYGKPLLDAVKKATRTGNVIQCAALAPGLKEIMHSVLKQGGSKKFGDTTIFQSLWGLTGPKKGEPKDVNYLLPQQVMMKDVDGNTFVKKVEKAYKESSGTRAPSIKFLRPFIKDMLPMVRKASENEEFLATYEDAVAYCQMHNLVVDAHADATMRSSLTKEERFLKKSESLVQNLPKKEREVLEAFINLDGQDFTREDIVNATGISRGLVRKHVDSLVSKGFITRTSGAPYRNAEIPLNILAAVDTQNSEDTDDEISFPEFFASTDDTDEAVEAVGSVANEDDSEVDTLVTEADRTIHSPQVQHMDAVVRTQRDAVNNLRKLGPGFELTFDPVNGMPIFRATTVQES